MRLELNEDELAEFPLLTAGPKKVLVVKKRNRKLVKPATQVEVGTLKEVLGRIAARRKEAFFADYDGARETLGARSVGNEVAVSIFERLRQGRADWQAVLSLSDSLPAAPYVWARIR